MRLPIVQSGGDMCIKVPATLFGGGNLTIISTAKYDVAQTANNSLTVTFSPNGTKSLTLFGLVAGPTGPAISQSSHFGVVITHDISHLGAPSGQRVKGVDVVVDPSTASFTAKK